MTSLRSPLTLACLALLGAAAGAQTAAQRATAVAPRGSGGITDIMRRAEQPAASLAPRAVPSAAAAAPRPPGVQRAAEYIVALVNSEPITNGEVQTRLGRMLESNPEIAERAPRAELARQVLERLIAERAQLQVAKESNLKVDELAIDQAEQIVARQNQISVDEVRRRIQADGISNKEFRNDLRNQLLLARLREREIEPKVKVSDIEVDQYLRDQRASAATAAPQDINVGQVLVAVPENASAAQLKTLELKAQAIAQRARGGEDFAKLVRENTDAPDRDNGGALGLRNIDRYPALFVDAIQSTPVGGVAGPVRSGAGFHVLKVLAKQKVGADAAVAQTQVRHILLRTDAKRSAAQAAEQLLDFKRRIQSGTADFAGLARDNSQDGSAKDGGDLGWHASGDFVPEFEESMNRLAAGQISEPVVTRFGVHLIQVMARREAKLSDTEQREAARNALREKRLDEAYETWAQEVRSRAYVEYRDPPQS